MRSRSAALRSPARARRWRFNPGRSRATPSCATAQAPAYQAQLDQIAGGLVTAFGESDQSNLPTLPTLAGLFTAPGMTMIPTSGSYQGLAATIEVNSNVDPNQGGNVLLLRDGGISSPGQSAYTYNATGDPRIYRPDSAIDLGPERGAMFDPNAGLGGSASVTALATNSVGWLQSADQSASDAASYQGSLMTPSERGALERHRRQLGH